ncbi:iron chelate uptake ABC transporter family permease subunit, partial [Streptomonospora algeriensis]
MRRKRTAWLWPPLALAVLAASMLAGVAAGAASTGPGDIAAALLSRIPSSPVDSPLSGLQEAVLIELRLPRVVLGALVGGLLASAGAAYQGVFRNPLADPYLLGAAAGAGLGATLVLAFGRQLLDSPGTVVPIAAFAGALDLRLGGRNVYGSRSEDRPELGEGRHPEVADIRRAVRLARAVNGAAAGAAAVLAL